MKEQIEEMAKIIAVQRGYDCAAHERCEESCIVYRCNPYEYAEVLYNAGYRKQSEGVWVSKEHISKSKRGRTIHYATYKCSVCGKWNGKHKQNYCPTCGAKMKGADDEKQKMSY